MKILMESTQSEILAEKDSEESLYTYYKTFPLETFCVKFGNLQKFRTAVLDSVKNCENWDVPSFFIIHGAQKSGKSCLFRSLFKNDSFYLKHILYPENLSKFQAEISQKAISGITPPDVIWIEGIDEQQALCLQDFRFVPIKAVIIEVSQEEYDWLPTFIKKITTSEVELSELSFEFSYKRFNQILFERNLPLLKNADEAVELIGEQKKIIEFGLEKMLLKSALERKRLGIEQLKFKPSTLCFSEEEYNRLVEDCSLEQNPYQQIKENLSREVKFLEINPKMLTKISKVLKNHPNMENREILDSVLKTEILFSTDKKLSLPPTLFVGPAGCGKTLLCTELREIFGQENDIFIPLGTGKGISYLFGSTTDYKAATHGEVLASIWKAQNYSCCLLNPLIIIDELEKGTHTHAGDVNQNVGTALLQIFGDENIKNFRDSFFPLKIDGFSPNFICTANSLEGISEPLLDRIPNVIRFREYTKEEMLEIVIPKKYERFRKHHTNVPDSLKEDEGNLIFKLSQGRTRKIDSALQLFLAASFSNSGKRKVLSSNDKDELCKKVTKNYASKIGFSF